ncbi:MAG: homoserine O-succinyltransferase [Clostridia bacterium]|nr:homoserine O-succinyltransferase [Clostridia bacterium]
MPIIIPKDIPAYKVLRNENIFVMTQKRAIRQDIRPIEIAILNLMPTKIATENQLIRLLSNSPLQVNITLLSTVTYQSKNTSKAHLEKFYKSFDDVSDRKFDGMIITGAPVETFSFEEVDYWEELTHILEYAKKHVTSTLFICWGAQAALKYYYGIGKNALNKKLFGVYEQISKYTFDPLLKGLDDVFYIPHSRHTASDEQAIRQCKELVVLAESEKTGPSILKSNNDKLIYFFGHSEYDKDTLFYEYERDINKGMIIDLPYNYFVDTETYKINVNWRSTANILFSNWLNYYVYQVTPYDLEKR